jgi:hypothetical protein
MTLAPPKVPKPAKANFEGVALTVVEDLQDASALFFEAWKSS